MGPGPVCGKSSIGFASRLPSCGTNHGQFRCFRPIPKFFGARCSNVVRIHVAPHVALLSRPHPVSVFWLRWHVNAAALRVEQCPFRLPGVRARPKRQSTAYGGQGRRSSLLALSVSVGGFWTHAFCSQTYIAHAIDQCQKGTSMT